MQDNESNQQPDTGEDTPFREYANNVYYDFSVWDLTLVFGQLATRTNASEVYFHTAVTLPWQQAKLMAYFLYINVLAFEQANGSISIPEGLVPEPGLPALHFEAQAKRLHAELFGSATESE